MEPMVKQFATWVALSLEAAAAFLIAIGGIAAMIGLLNLAVRRDTRVSKRKEVWVRFGLWLLIGLEFELAADVVRTAIAPSWMDIGQLGAIAAIRTFLNYFLEKDIEKYGRNEERPKP